MRRRWPLPLLLAATTGCWELLPAARDPLLDARHREPELCRSGPASYPQGLFDPRSVIAVAPLFLMQSQRGSQDAHLRGATLEILPAPGVTPTELERLLNCHAARRELDRPGEPQPPNDPYALPGHVVRMSVHFDEGRTSVAVEVKDVEGANEILRRAVAFRGH